MNKKISTLLTAGLLMVGALLGSANAAPTAEAAKGDLQNGAKFYLGNTNGFIKVDQTYKVNGTAVSTYNATGDLAIEMLLCLKLLIMLTMQLVTFLRLH